MYQMVYLQRWHVSSGVLTALACIKWCTYSAGMYQVVYLQHVSRHIMVSTDDEERDGKVSKGNGSLGH